jgi:hypothetical protein
MAGGAGDAGECRVVISGMGAVSAAGLGAEKLWKAARDGISQIRELKTERPYDGRIKIAAQVPDFDPAAHIDANLLPFCDPFTQFSVIAADEALAQAGFTREGIGGPRTGVIIGSGIGGMETIDDGLYHYYRPHFRGGQRLFFRKSGIGARPADDPLRLDRPGGRRRRGGLRHQRDDSRLGGAARHDAEPLSALFEGSQWHVAWRRRRGIHPRKGE